MAATGVICLKEGISEFRFVIVLSLRNPETACFQLFYAGDIQSLHGAGFDKRLLDGGQARIADSVGTGRHQMQAVR